MRCVSLRISSALIFPVLCAFGFADDAISQSEGIDFFETNIRPVLVEKCYACHSQDADSIEGDLELDTAAGVIAGSASGPIVNREKIDASLLLRALRHEDGIEAMPPEEKLSEGTIQAFKRWIEMGQPDPRDGRTTRELQYAERLDHWAFQRPQTSDAPTVEQKDWPRGTIDAFVLAKLESEELVPAPDANRATLARRLYFDLIGLPPTPADIEQFINDSAADADARLIDQLLASPRFGERWGRHWLDVVRFAESSGKEFNFTYPHAWPYRDYVIAAFNKDKPYSEFIREQIAGDLIPARPYETFEEREARLVATSVLSFGTKRHNSGGTAFRMEIVDDQIDMTCRAILGMTVACAKCHDHKFDPVPTKEYYSLAGIFLSTDPLYGTIKQKYSNSPTDLLPLGTDGQEMHDALKAHEKMVAAVEKPRDAKKTELAEAEKAKAAAGQKKTSAEERLAKETVEEKKAAIQKEIDEAIAAIKSSTGKIAQIKAELPPLASAVEELKKQRPPTPAYAMSVRDRDKPTDTQVAIRGDLGKRGEVAPRGFLTALNVDDVPTINAKQSGRRELADWMTSPRNPLTARVIVNRVWHHLFGRGIVETVDNFGLMGTPPTHQKLLDTLAVEFIEDGWSIKRLVRRIATSRTYQLSCNFDSQNMESDPDNRFLWRSSPRRLSVEVMRDAILAVSGQLDLEPPSGSTVTGLGDQMVRGVPTDKLQPPSKHRSVYLPVVRDYAPKMFDRFDFPSSALVSGKRAITNTPSQALFLRNSEFIAEQSGFAAKRILAEHPDDDESTRVQVAMRWVFGRSAQSAERDEAIKLLDSVKQSEAKIDDKNVAAWTALFKSLFATAEFRYLVDVEEAVEDRKEPVSKNQTAQRAN